MSDGSERDVQLAEIAKHLEACVRGLETLAVVMAAREYRRVEDDATARGDQASLREWVEWLADVHASLAEHKWL